MCRDIAIEHLLWYFLYCTISMNVFSSEGTVQVFKKSRCVPGCYGSLDGAPSCKPKGSLVGSQSGHMPGKKRSVVRVEKML